MENVAAVTFSERFISKGVETNGQREERAEVILHEMAHMWFGNLVTMRWWNDLWLNESFATFMASKSMYEATEFKTAWQTFYQDMKQWAYWEDQLVTSHPILAEIKNTSESFNNFDGITYGKGASVLKQLDFFVGSDVFRNGVRQYLKDFAYSNATLSDFLNAQNNASKLNLQGWSEDWLKTSSLNSIHVEFKCNERNKIESFKLVQSGSEANPLLRSHRANVAIYVKSSEGKIVERRVVNLSYHGSETSVPSLVSEQCPVFVYPNSNDMDYVRVELDPVSLKTAKTELVNFEDQFSRSMIWQSLWDMVYDAQLKAADYAEIAMSQLDAEKDSRIALAVLSNLYGKYPNSPTVIGFMPNASAEEQRVHHSMLVRIEDFLTRKLQSAEAGTDLQRIWFESLAQMVTSEKVAQWFERLLDGKESVKGLTVDQDARWLIVGNLSRLGRESAKALIASESKRDHSSRGQQSAIAAKAMNPDPRSKETLVKKYVFSTKSVPFASQKSVMVNLFPPTQQAAARSYQAEFFRRLPGIVSKKDGAFIEDFVSNFAPNQCDDASSHAIADYLSATSSKLNAIAIKGLKVVAQENDRCVKVMNFSRSAKSNM
jgi:aminopeptidase N